jgi:RNA polymerase sigma-70 factor (ECF subfamily)
MTMLTDAAPVITWPRQLRETVKACARCGGRVGKFFAITEFGPARRETSAVSRTASSLVATYSPNESLGRLEVNDPHRYTGAATSTDSHDPGCDDSALLNRIGEGDEDAMAAFYREHGRVVFAQVLLVTGERVLAEEIVQDTMLAVWRGASSFRGEASVRSWVIAIARRQTRDRLRGRRLRVVDDAFLADQPGAGPGPEVTALDRAELADVRTAIRKLVPAHREVLGLAFGSGLSLPEVASVLEIPVGTVKSRLTSARTALNRILEKGQDR